MTQTEPLGGFNVNPSYAGVVPLIDPNHPPQVFDGKLKVNSTCRACGEIMTVIHASDKTHPTCYKVETQLESLTQLWLSEVKAGDDAQAKLTEQLMNEVSVLDIASAAVEYTTWEWPVFPLRAGSSPCLNNRTEPKCKRYCQCGKIPAIPKPKGNGFKDATTDTVRIDKWWTKHPEHNIGLATGHLFDVIDIDTKDSKGNPNPAGVQSFMALMESGDIPEVHGVAITASGGMHLYVMPTGKGIYAGIRPGIDYRGIGGYVLAPPSRLDGPGRQYSWLCEPSPLIKGDNK